MKRNTPTNLKINPTHLTTLCTEGRVSTIYVTTSDSLTSHTWVFDLATRELSNTTHKIKLTIIESLLMNAFALSSTRICSKQELILSIGKDPQTYSGLEMCLSRLQNKFRDASNERLFRSVRNRGYCLVQDMKKIKI